MLKAYVSSHQYRDQPGEREIFDVGFDPRPEKALYYPTWGEAEND
jgi:hypothetical protein